MNDPFKVLGVSPNASDDEIKDAYRRLARKYHPDNYQNNPLSDLALEKMKEINEAYDQIQSMRKSGGSGQRSQASANYQQNTSSEYTDIRRLIMANKITEAMELLDGVPVDRRSAEWYFLKGNVHYKRGWLEEAMNCFAQASRLDPNNAEYQAAINQLLWQRQTAGPTAGGYRTTTAGPSGCLCSPCDMCTSLICADCCCECMGGDCIRCC